MHSIWATPAYVNSIRCFVIVNWVNCEMGAPKYTVWLLLHIYNMPTQPGQRCPGCAKKRLRRISLQFYFRPHNKYDNVFVLARSRLAFRFQYLTYIRVLCETGIASWHAGLVWCESRTKSEKPQVLWTSWRWFGDIQENHWAFKKWIVKRYVECELYMDLWVLLFFGWNQCGIGRFFKERLREFSRLPSNFPGSGCFGYMVKENAVVQLGKNDGFSLPWQH